MTAPLVSIGMPVRNGERFLEQALTSLLDQEFQDFELLVSDNASDDATADICRSFAHDRRLRYRRQDSDIGANANFNYLLSQASSQYFMWAAHDDVWRANYLSECLARLVADDSTISCATGIELIDVDKQRIGIVLDDGGLSSKDWRARVGAMVARRDGHVGFGFYGLHRTPALRGVGPLGQSFGADVVLMLRMAILGRWAFVAEPLFQYRIAPKPADVSWSGSPQVSLAESHPASQLVREVWAALGEGAPTRRAGLLARFDLARAIARRSSGWHEFLLGENGALLRSALVRKDVVSIARHVTLRLLLDPLAPLRRSNWHAAGQLRRDEERLQQSA